MAHFISILFLSIFSFGLSANGQPVNATYYILLSKVDNQAKVYVNGEEVYDTGDVGRKVDMGLRITLDDHLKSGKNIVKVECYNGSEDYVGYDSNWEIYYELFEGEDPIDFANEQARDGKQGLAFTMTHEVYID